MQVEKLFAVCDTDQSGCLSKQVTAQLQLRAAREHLLPVDQEVMNLLGSDDGDDDLKEFFSQMDADKVRSHVEKRFDARVAGRQGDAERGARSA